VTCFDCNLPDHYNGAGDGIGSCDCPRCDRCGEPPGLCTAACDDDLYDLDDEIIAVEEDE